MKEVHTIIQDGTIFTQNEKTIGDIATEIGYDMNNFAVGVSDGVVENYKSNYYYIDKTSDANEYNSNNQTLQNIIYPSAANATLTESYWLSSSCVYASFYSDDCEFYVRFVSSSKVDAKAVIGSIGGSYGGEYAIRPVVKLSPDVNLSFDGTSVTLK